MRILIVEDEHDLGAAVQERVRQDGHAVDWFMTLEDARAAVATVDYDFMLLDLGLPDGNGRDLLRDGVVAVLPARHRNVPEWSLEETTARKDGR